MEIHLGCEILILINVIGMNPAIDTSYRDKTGLTILAMNQDDFIFTKESLWKSNLVVDPDLDLDQYDWDELAIDTSYRDRTGLTIIAMNPEAFISATGSLRKFNLVGNPVLDLDQNDWGKSSHRYSL